MEIRILESEKDILFCSNAIMSFRPNLKAENLVEQTNSMRKEGFRMAFIPNDDDSEAAAIIGYRSFEMYRTGIIIYIDDLFTFPENRGKGYASALLDYVHHIASESGIKTVHLDSGYNLHPAHRLYLNKGYVLPCHHFARIID